MSPLELIREANRRRGWDAKGKRLAEAAGLHVTITKRYLDGDTSVGAKNAGKIASALGLSVEEVLYGRCAA